MSLTTFTLKGNHRDTFRLVPVGQSVVDPGTYIHSPTNPSGFADFEATPANYYVYARPAYTSEFVLLESGVLEPLQYLRTLNPEITSDGIIELTSLVTTLSIDFTTEFNNLPYVRNNEIVSLRVIATAGGVPSSPLGAVPVLNIYKKEDNSLVQSVPFIEGKCSDTQYTTEASCESNSETWTQLYDLANPHIYTYEHSFSTTTETEYYFRAFASAENTWSPEYPDVDLVNLDYTAPDLLDPQNQVFLSSASSDLTDTALTSTASVFISIPESAITDNASGPEFYHIQPFMQNKQSDSPTGLEYSSNNPTFDFEDTNLANWDLVSGNGFNLLITDNNGDEQLFVNYGTLTNNNADNEFIINIDATSAKFTLASDPGSNFTVGSYYNYRIFKHGYNDICVGNPTETDQTACLQGGVCSGGGHTNQTDCEEDAAGYSWTANYWKTGQQFVKDWPIEFSTTGNVIQALLLTQDLPNGFLDNFANGIEYGFLVSGSDRAGNANTDKDAWLSPNITFDSAIEIAPNLNWYWVDNYSKNPLENTYVNENNWFNTGELAEETGGVCSGGSHTNKTDCEADAAGYTWIPDTLTLIVQCVDGQTQAENSNFGIQWSYDNQNWRTVVSTDNLNIGTSKYYINEFDTNEPLRQGTHTLYIRGVNNDGTTATGSSQTINYQWDRLRPVWSSPGTTEEIGGWNRAYINWTTGPLDAGDAGTSDVPGSGGNLDTGEGFSGTKDIEIWRSIKQSTTPHLWNVVSANPSQYGLTKVGTISAGETEFTDISFNDISYDAQSLPPYYYWGVPVDQAGNGAWDKANATGATPALLTQLDANSDTLPDGITIIPLQPADVAGTLGTTIYVPNNILDTIEVHRDIAVPTDGLILRTNEIVTLYALHKLSYSADGYNYTNIPAVQYLGEHYTLGHLDFTNTPSVSFTSGGQILISSTTASALNLDHLLNVMSSHDRAFTGLTYITSSRCKIGGVYSALPSTKAKAFCDTNGGTWEEERKIAQFEEVTEVSGNVILQFATLDNGDLANWTSRYGDNTWLIEFGFRLDVGMNYVFNFPVIDNQYFYRLTFNEDVPTASYCDSYDPAHTTQTLCEAAGANWNLPDVPINNDAVNFATKLAADLIVGGTLRLEEGLSIWSGEFINGERTGSGVLMDEQGVRLFKDDQNTVELDAVDGSFRMGDLSDPAGNKISFDTATGQLSLIGNLYQIDSSNTYSGNTVFVGNWSSGTCDTNGSCLGTEVTLEDCNACGGNFTYSSYVAGEIVLYNGNYWLCISNVSTGEVPSATNDTYWALYASGGIQGDSAQNLQLQLDNNIFTVNEFGIPISPAHIAVLPTVSNVAGNINYDTTAIDLSDAAITQDANGLAVPLYSDLSGTQISTTSPNNQPVYIYLSDLTSVKRVTVEATIEIQSLEGETLVDIADSATLHRVQEGTSAYSIILSNQTHSVTMDEFGNVNYDDWQSSFTNVQLYRGTEQVNCSVVLSNTTTNWSSTILSGQNTVPQVQLHDNNNDAASTVGTVTITVYDVDTASQAGDVVFTVNKIGQGASTRSVSLSPSAFTYTVDPNGGNEVVSPINTDAGNAIAVDFTVISSNLNIDTVAWGCNPSSGVNGVAVPSYSAGTGSPSDVNGQFQVISGSAGQGSEHRIRLYLDTAGVLYGANNESIEVTVSVTDQSGGTCTNTQYNTEATCLDNSGTWTQGETFTDNVVINRLFIGGDAYVGSLSNDNYTIPSTYTGDLSVTPDAGGSMSLYRGTTLLTDPDVSFGTKGTWFGRVWHNWDPGFDDLTIANIIARGKPDQTASHHWSAFNNNSQIQGATFFETDPVDHFVGWVTTWIKASSNTTLNNLVFSGDNAHKFYINNAPIVEEASWNVDTTYSYTINPTSGWASPNDTASTGPWYRLDIIWWESTGGDHVQMGWNPQTIPGLEGYGGVVADINATTGIYTILQVEEFVEQATATFTATSTSDSVEVSKDYSLSVAQSGAPGTYLKSLYFTGTYGTFNDLESFMQNNGGYDWPLDNLTATTLTGWVETLPVEIADLPGNTTWMTQRVLRVDGTTIEGEEWSSPTIATHSPENPIQYYIKPLNGTTLHNGQGSLNIQAIQAQDGVETEINSGTTGINLSLSTTGSPSLGSNTSFTDTDITGGSLTVYLVNTSVGPTILDTITLIDLHDGVPAGAVTGDPGLVFTEVTPGVYTPAAITVTANFYDSLGAISQTSTGTLQCVEGNISISQSFDNTANITTVPTGTGTGTVALEFTDNTTGISVQETIYASQMGIQGDSIQGEQGPATSYTGGWDDSRTWYFAGTSGDADDSIGEIVRFDYLTPTAPKSHHEEHGTAYICQIGHEPDVATNAPADTSGVVHPYWKAFGGNFESIATGLLLSDTVIAKDIFGDSLELTESFKLKSPEGYCSLQISAWDDLDETGALSDWVGDGANDHTDYNGHWMLGYTSVPPVGDVNPQLFAYYKWDAVHDGNEGAAGWPDYNIMTSQLNHPNYPISCIAFHSHDYLGNDRSAIIQQLAVGDVIAIELVGTNYASQKYYFKIQENSDKKNAGLPTGVYRANELDPTANSHVFQIDVEALSETVDLGTGATLTSSPQYDANTGGGYANNGVNLTAISPGGAYNTESSCIGASFANGDGCPAGTWISVSNEINISREGIHIKDRNANETVAISADSGDFTFGRPDLNQSITWTGAAGLRIEGNLYVEGTEINQGLRQVELSVENPIFTWEQQALNEEFYANVNGNTELFSLPFTYDDTTGGPVLVRVKVNDPENGLAIELNGVELTPRPNWQQQIDQGSLDNEGVCYNDSGGVESGYVYETCSPAGHTWEWTYRWHEYYNDGSATQVGTNQIVLKNPTPPVADGLRINHIQAYTTPTQTSITIDSTGTNLNAATDPTYTWSVTEAYPANSSLNLSIPFTDNGNGSITVTLDDFNQNLSTSPIDDDGKALLAQQVNVNLNVSHADWSTDVFDNLTLSRNLAGGQGTDSINGYLTNESVSIPMADSGSWSGSEGGTFKVFQGVSDITTTSCTFSHVPGANVTGTINSTTGVYSITALGNQADAGILTLTAVCMGVTVEKVFTISLSRAGEQGIDGSPGAAQFFYNDLDTSGSGQSPKCFQFESGAAVFPAFNGTGGLVTNFEAANKVVINTEDANGQNNKDYFMLMKAGTSLIYHIDPTRWYHFTLLADPVDDSGMTGHGNTVTGDRVGFSIQIVDYVTGDNSELTAGVGEAPAYFFMGAVVPSVRGSRTFTDEWCDEGGWSDQHATDIASEDGGPVKRDMVTLYCDAEQYSTSKYWTGSGWSTVTSVIDGNLLVTGTVAAQHLAADSVTADKIEVGAVTADKIAIGASGNLLGLQIKDADNWAHLLQAGWTSSFDTSIIADTSRRDPNSHDNMTLPALRGTNNSGQSFDSFTSPKIPIDPNSNYQISLMMNMYQPQNARGRYYIGVDFYDHTGSNITSATRVYKQINGTDNWEDRNWSSQDVESTSNNYYWAMYGNNLGAESYTQVSTYGQEAGLSSTYKYRDYWFPVTIMAYSAGTTVDAAKSGGNVLRNFQWMRGLRNDQEYAPSSIFGNAIMHSGAAFMRLRFLLYQDDNAAYHGDQVLHIAGLKVTEGVGTQIDGASITTGSITADQIVSNYLDAVNVTADNLRAGTIASSNLSTWWDLGHHVFIARDGGVNRVCIGDLSRCDDEPPAE